MRIVVRAIGVVMALGWGVSASAADQDPITLYYWAVTENDALALDVVKDFERLHDGSNGERPIKVVMGQSASVNKTNDPQRLLCGIAGGDPPDVVDFDRFAVGEWAARGTFENLQAFYERDLAESSADPYTLRQEMFYDPCWAEANYDGSLFAIPSSTDNRVLFYNLDLMEKHAERLIAAGCVDENDPTKVGPPRTWEQLRAATEILTEFDENGKLVRAGFIPNYGNSWLYIYGWLNGGKFLSDDGLTCTLADPNIVDSLAYMTELYNILGGAEQGYAFQNSVLQAQDLEPFISGKVAMKIDVDDFMTIIANHKRDMRFGVALAPAPEGRSPLGWCGGWAWVIPKGSKHPEEAWKFIKYLSSQRAFSVRLAQGRQQARSTGNVYLPSMSARKDITEWAFQTQIFDDPTIEDKFKDAKRTTIGAMPISKYRPVTPVGQVLWNEQVRGMEGGLFMRYDPDDIRNNAKLSLERSAAVVQQELDRIYKPVAYPELSWKPVVAGYVVLVLGAVGFVYWHFNRRLQARGYFRKEFYAGYLFALPWFVGFLVFGGGPIVFSLFMSFCEYDVFSPPKWVGLKNYSAMLGSEPLFYKSLWNTVFMCLRIPLGMAVSLGIAMLLSYEIRGMAIYRTFFYMPAVMPAVAASILWIWIFNSQEGILNSMLAWFGIAGPAWLQDQQWSKPALILMSTWGAGGGMIIWLAGLKGIPVHLYEAAEIDGAGRLRRFWNITVPMLSPYILFNIIMGLIGTFQIFTEAYIMTQGGPVDSTLFYVYELFNNAFRYMKMGYASAMAWILFAIVLALTAMQLYVSKHWVHYEAEE